MNFNLEKKNALEKKDKSRKNRVDKEIKDVLDKINSFDNYFTTSSCSGRIVLISIPENGKKNQAEWLFVSHQPVKVEDIKIVIKTSNPVWFKQESAILHVCCSNLEKADKLLRMIKECGFKRAGIIALAPKIICEIIGSESISTIISKEKMLVSDEYLAVLVEEANKKMMLNQKRIMKLLEGLDNL